MKVVLNLLAGDVIVLVVLAFIFPWGKETKEQAKKYACLSNVKQQANALIIYQSDFDDRYPKGRAWMDAIMSRMRDQMGFHHPVPDWQRTYGYAFNASLLGMKTPSRPEAVPLVYADGTRDGWWCREALEQSVVRHTARPPERGGPRGALLARLRQRRTAQREEPLPVERQAERRCTDDVRLRRGRSSSAARPMDGCDPYTKTEALWHCPSVPKGACGYAFDADLSGLKQTKIADPSSEPQVYDSVDPIRNASDRVASLPLPGRHGDRDNVAYADGHAKGVLARPVLH